jgi:hypothetical protein
MFRASIIYTGKYADKTGCAFLKAHNKEDAKKYIEVVIKASLKKFGYPEDCFKVDITTSSKEEVDFYLANEKTSCYNGLAN